MVSIFQSDVLVGGSIQMGPGDQPVNFGQASNPIGSMYGIYTNIGGILMGSMLPYIAAPWILWEPSTSEQIAVSLL